MSRASRRDSSSEVPEKGALFRGWKFFLTQRVPMRSRFIQDIKDNGGTVVGLEGSADVIIADHARSNPPPGSLSFTFIEACIKEGIIVAQEHYRAGSPSREPRQVGSSKPVKTGRNKYSAEDDRALYQWVKACALKGESIRGNTIYQKFEKINPRHPWQSWRDRYIKFVHNNPPAIIATHHTPPTPPSDRDRNDAAVTLLSPHSTILRGESLLGEPDGNKSKANGLNATSYSFTDDDRRLLAKEASQLQDLKARNYQIFWDELAQRRPNHSAAEWRDFYEKEIVPYYEKSWDNDERAEDTQSLVSGIQNNDRYPVKGKNSNETNLSSTNLQDFSPKGFSDAKRKRSNLRDMDDVVQSRRVSVEGSDASPPFKRRRARTQIRSGSAKYSLDPRFEESPSETSEHQRILPALGETESFHLTPNRVKIPDKAPTLFIPEELGNEYRKLHTDFAEQARSKSDDHAHATIFMRKGNALARYNHDTSNLQESRGFSSPIAVYEEAQDFEDVPPNNKENESLVDAGLNSFPPNKLFRADEALSAFTENEVSFRLEPAPIRHTDLSFNSESEDAFETAPQHHQPPEPNEQFATDGLDLTLPGPSDDEGQDEWTGSNPLEDNRALHQSHVALRTTPRIATIPIDAVTATEDDVDAFVAENSTLGHTKYDILTALKHTTMDFGLAQIVLDHLRQYGAPPNNTAGIWTDDDDAVLMGGDAVKMKMLEDFHGKERHEERLRALKEWGLF